MYNKETLDHNLSANTTSHGEIYIVGRESQMDDDRWGFQRRELISVLCT